MEISKKVGSEIQKASRSIKGRRRAKDPHSQGLLTVKWDQCPSTGRKF